MTVIPGPPYPGVYKHYKGDYYVVHKVITDSTNNRPGRDITDGRIMVLYESLKTKELHVRAILEFQQLVHSDGMPSIQFHLPGAICGKCIPRFKFMDRTEIDETLHP